VPTLIAKAITAEAGLDVPVLVRSADELAAVARANPFHADPKTLHVAFLSTKPTAAQVAALDLRRSPPDEFVVRGREIYLRLPSGVARTRLTNAYFDAKLETVSTLRGMATIEKLLALCRA
jgi:uncharacterized protein (DUF1697 family)